ncbi:hypothetical protein GGX14DRAFT_653501 [Mycena pura]|uniref:Uncharacterized protein n=1 Tax=Mycena pura TaxID=153505 RepID=A0AAD6V5T9_9AGAR|nr:hypothetical protein GGX14DRAFT_653501 [Mycena pura]
MLSQSVHTATSAFWVGCTGKWGSKLPHDVNIRAGTEVELAGWPAGIDFVQPAKIHQMGELHRIRDGLRNGQIRWVYLTRSQLDALEAELDEHRKAGLLKKQAPRSDKGKKRGPRKNNNKVADRDSNDENDDDDDYDDDDNADDETTALAAVITNTTTRAAPISNTVHMRATTPTAAHAADAMPVNTTPATTRAAEPTPANAADATPINTTPATRATEARPANAAHTATHATDAVHANTAPTAAHVTEAACASVNAAGATPVGAANITTVPLGPAASAFTVFTVNMGHSAGSNVASKPRKKRSDAGQKRKRSADENLDPNATAPPANHDRGNTGLDTAEPAAKRQKRATKTTAAATISAAVAADMI